MWSESVDNTASSTQVWNITIPRSYTVQSSPLKEAPYLTSNSLPSVPNNRFHSPSILYQNPPSSLHPKMAFPPITHPHTAYPNPRHSARLSTRWSRYSQLTNEDWREGGMGEPLVHPDDLSFHFHPPHSTTLSIPQIPLRLLLHHERA